MKLKLKNASKLASISKKIRDISGVSTVNYGGESTQDMVKTLQTIQTGGNDFYCCLSNSSIIYDC